MHYDLDKGMLTTTMDRFKHFNTECGYPYRELVGCLLWISLCVMGPELLRVKDLARRSNDYSDKDYKEALRVLRRINDRKSMGLSFVGEQLARSWYLLLPDLD
jgi:hypothetical protein